MDGQWAGPFLVDDAGFFEELGRDTASDLCGSRWQILLRALELAKEEAIATVEPRLRDIREQHEECLAKRRVMAASSPSLSPAPSGSPSSSPSSSHSPHPHREGRAKMTSSSSASAPPYVECKASTSAAPPPPFPSSPSSSPSPPKTPSRSSTSGSDMSGSLTSPSLVRKTTRGRERGGDSVCGKGATCGSEGRVGRGTGGERMGGMRGRGGGGGGAQRKSERVEKELKKSGGGGGGGGRVVQGIQKGRGLGVGGGGGRGKRGGGGGGGRGEGYENEEKIDEGSSGAGDGRSDGGGGKSDGGYRKSGEGGLGLKGKSVGNKEDMGGGGGSPHSEIVYWQQKAEALDSMLVESLQREEFLLQRVSGSVSYTAGLELLEEYQRQLRRYEMYLHLVMSNKPLFLGFQDKDLRYRLAFNCRYPMKREAIIGKTDSDIMHESTAAVLEEAKKMALSSGKRVIRECELKLASGAEDGSMVVMRRYVIAVEPVFSMNREIVGVNVAGLDITDSVTVHTGGSEQKGVSPERGSRTRVLLSGKNASTVEDPPLSRQSVGASVSWGVSDNCPHAGDSLEITEELLSKQFLATILYEIRSPLSWIVSLIESLQGTELKAEQRKLADLIEASGELLHSFLNDIIDLSSLESGGAVMDENQFSPSELLRQVAQMGVFAVHAKRTDVTLDCELSVDVPDQVIGDSLRLLHILANLISNAVKFTEKGKVHVKMKRIEGPWSWVPHRYHKASRSWKSQIGIQDDMSEPAAFSNRTAKAKQMGWSRTQVQGMDARFHSKDEAEEETTSHPCRRVFQYGLAHSRSGRMWEEGSMESPPGQSSCFGLDLEEKMTPGTSVESSKATRESVTPKDVWLQCEVSDTGVGMEEEEIETIFDRYSLPSIIISRRHGSTGLGLAVCKQLVESMGGHIDVESQVGKGSTITFYVRLKAMAAAQESDTRVTGDARMRAISPIQLPIEKLELLRRLNVRSNAGNSQRICSFAFQDGDSVVSTPCTMSPIVGSKLPLSSPEDDGLLSSQGPRPVDELHLRWQPRPFLSASCWSDGKRSHPGSFHQRSLGCGLLSSKMCKASSPSTYFGGFPRHNLCPILEGAQATAEPVHAAATESQLPHMQRRASSGAEQLNHSAISTMERKVQRHQPAGYSVEMIVRANRDTIAKASSEAVDQMNAQSASELLTGARVTASLGGSQNDADLQQSNIGIGQSSAETATPEQQEGLECWRRGAIHRGAMTSRRQTCNVDGIPSREGDREDAVGIRISDKTPVRGNSYLRRGLMELRPSSVTGVPAPSRQVIGTCSHGFGFSGGVPGFGRCDSGFTEERIQQWEKTEEQSLCVRMNDNRTEAQSSSNPISNVQSNLNRSTEMGHIDGTGVTSLPGQPSGACAHGFGLARGASNLGGCGSSFAGGSIPSLEKIEHSSGSRKNKRAEAQSSSSSVQQGHSALNPCHLPGGRPATATRGLDLEQALRDDTVCLGKGVHCKARVHRVFTQQAVQSNQSPNRVSFTGVPGTRGRMAEDDSQPESEWRRLHGGAPGTVERDVKVRTTEGPRFGQPLQRSRSREEIQLFTDTKDQSAEISIVNLQRSPATLTSQAQRPIATNIADSERSPSYDCPLVARRVRDNHTPPSECLWVMERAADVESEPHRHTVSGVALGEAVRTRPKPQAVTWPATSVPRHSVGYWNPESISGDGGGGHCRDGNIPCSGHRRTADREIAQQPQHCRQPGIVQHSDRQCGTTLQQHQQPPGCCLQAYQPQHSHRQQEDMIHQQGMMTKQEHEGIQKKEQIQHGLWERRRQKLLQEELHRAQQHHLDHLLHHKVQLQSQPEFMTRYRYKEESYEHLRQREREMQAQQQDEVHKMHLEDPLFQEQGLAAGDNPSCTLLAPEVSLRAGPSDRRAKTKDWPRILLAEDNAVSVTISIAILEGMGLTASAVSNGVEALQALRMDTYHLVFMDVRMPVMDGFEATSMIRKLEKSGMWRGPRGVPGIVPSTAMKGSRMEEGYTTSSGELQRGKIPIIAMVTNIAPDNVAKCFAYGMDACIPKPLTASKFREFIRQFCRGVNLPPNLHC